MSEEAKTSRAIPSDEYWKHKARALLVPTPLADLDPAGEEARARKVLDVLRLEPPRLDLHARCNEDARGVHVPDIVVAMSGRMGAAGEASLDALVHPLSGEKPKHPASEHIRLDGLLRRYDGWVDPILRRLQAEPPDRYQRFSHLWHEIQRSVLGGPNADWLSRCAGHPALRDHNWLAHRTMASALVGARFEGTRPCLLYVHCGPVQGFIAAARRTSDLWLGSYLVSLLAYQATKAIAERCGPDSLIYPHLASLPLALRDLAYPEIKGRTKVVPPEKQDWLFSSQPNRFVAVVDDARARSIAEAAARAVLQRWTDMGDRVARKLPVNLGADEIEDFERQVAEHLEVDIVVQPWSDSPDDARATPYAETFALGRKTLASQRRVLPALPSPGDSRIKCSQCGLREAIGPKRRDRKEWAKWWNDIRNALQRQANPSGADEPDRPETLDFRRGEALCAVCLTKRLAHRFDLGGDDSELGLQWGRKAERVLLRFPSVATVASAPLRLHLLEHADDHEVRAWMGHLRTLHGELGFDPPGNLLPGLGELGRAKELLNYDGTWLYARSYERDTVLNDHDRPEIDVDALAIELVRAREAYGKLGKLLARALGRPQGSSVRATPYYAVVMIDVDDMGKWLEGKHGRRPMLRDVLLESGAAKDTVEAEVSPDEPRPVSSSLHAEVSRRQGELATRRLRGIVENDHLGRVVYSGGDDVLAFVPLHTLWSCLHRIAEAFTDDTALGSRVTLSAGVAICDWRSPLSLALRMARDAEGKAKQTKSCIVVDIDIRSGAPIELRLPWRLPHAPASICDVGKMISELVGTGSESHDEQEAAPLLRPTAVEALRRELDTLHHGGLEAAFEQRVRELVGAGRETGPWIEWLLRERKAGSMGQVIEFLLLLRFLAREQGGIDHQELLEQIKEVRR